MRHLNAGFWWILVLRGLLSLLLGLESMAGMLWLNGHYDESFQPFLWARPDIVLTLLIFLLVVYAFLDGIFSILLGLQDFGNGERWWTSVLEGLFSLALGTLTWVRPGVGALPLLYWIAFCACVSGWLEMGQGLRGTEYRDRRPSFFYAGLFSMVFGILVLGRFVGADGLVWAISLYLCFFSIPLLVLGIHLRHFRKIRIA